jgi:hypothetical protein
MALSVAYPYSMHVSWKISLHAYSQFFLDLSLPNETLKMTLAMTLDGTATGDNVS